jgi:L-fuconolactonase
MRIDSHQHFWKYHPAHQVWMTDRMAALRRDYLPEELLPLLQASQFDGCIAVQARQMVEETEWLLELADDYAFIKGVVGWVDLRSPELHQQIEKYSAHPKLVGVRHVVHDEPDDDFMLRPEFRRGIAQLAEFNLTYDLLLFPRHLPVAMQLASEFTDQPFVLDHIAKPGIRQGLLSPWKEDLEQLAELPNVFCKLSGLVTEAKWNAWRSEDFHRYLDAVITAFGTRTRDDRVGLAGLHPLCGLQRHHAHHHRLRAAIHT